MNIFRVHPITYEYSLSCIYPLLENMQLRYEFHSSLFARISFAGQEIDVILNHVPLKPWHKEVANHLELDS